MASVKLIAALNAVHTYFEPTERIGLKFSIGAASQQWAKRYGVYLNTTFNGCTVYSNSSAETSRLLETIKNTTGTNALRIDVYAANANFYVFTKLPKNWLGIVQYKSSNVTKQPDEIQQLTPTHTTTSAANKLGEVTLYFDDLVKTNTPNNYQLHFEARATQWNYYVINNGDAPLVNPFIETKNKIAFKKPVEVELQNNTKALLFSSGDSNIPLASTPKQKFKLMDDLGMNSANKKKTRTIFKNLPNPIPTRTSIAQTNEIYVSPMYIYL